jgi:hypothetical protein
LLLSRANYALVRCSHGRPWAEPTFTETIQNLREEEQRKKVSSQLRKVLGFKEEGKLPEHANTKIATLIDVISTQNEADMELHACREILDCMQAYYKV